MNNQWSERIARNLWWLSGAASLISFNVLVIGSAAISRRIYWQYDLDETRRDCLEGLIIALLYGNFCFGMAVSIASFLLFLILRNTSRWRRLQMFVLGLAGASLSGALLLFNWRFDADGVGGLGFPPAYPIAAFPLILFGLPLSWSLALIFASITERNSKTAWRT